MVTRAAKLAAKEAGTPAVMSGSGSMDDGTTAVNPQLPPRPPAGKRASRASSQPAAASAVAGDSNVKDLQTAAACPANDLALAAPSTCAIASGSVASSHISEQTAAPLAQEPPTRAPSPFSPASIASASPDQHVPQLQQQVQRSNGLQVAAPTASSLLNSKAPLQGRPSGLPPPGPSMPLRRTRGSGSSTKLQQPAEANVAPAKQEVGKDDASVGVSVAAAPAPELPLPMQPQACMVDAAAAAEDDTIMISSDTEAEELEVVHVQDGKPDAGAAPLAPSAAAAPAAKLKVVRRRRPPAQAAAASAAIARAAGNSPPDAALPAPAANGINAPATQLPSATALLPAKKVSKPRQRKSVAANAAAGVALAVLDAVKAAAAASDIPGTTANAGEDGNAGPCAGGPSTSTATGDANDASMNGAMEKLVSMLVAALPPGAATASGRMQKAKKPRKPRVSAAGAAAMARAAVVDAANGSGEADDLATSAAAVAASAAAAALLVKGKGRGKAAKAAAQAAASALAEDTDSDDEQAKVADAVAKPKGRGKGTKARKAAKPVDDADEEEAESDSGVSIAEEGPNPWGPFGEGEMEEQEEEDTDATPGYHFKESREPPPELLMSLLPYQKQFLAWAIKQEQSSVKGGILADEMGMGKTIQAISVIVTHRADDFSTTYDAAAAAGAAGPAKVAAPAAPKPRIGLGTAHRPPATTADEAVEAAAEAAAPSHLPIPRSVPPSEDAVVAAKAASAVPRRRGGAAATAPAASLAPALTSANSLPAPAGACLPGCSDASCGGLQHAASAPVSPTPAGLCKHQLALQSKGKAKLKKGQKCYECEKEAEPAALPMSSTVFCKATLVVCPVVAIIQWKGEIARFTAPGAIKVVIYHGSKRSTDLEELRNADVVLTTYSVIENEHRRFMAPSKVVCEYCKKRFYAERLKLHLRYFCGPHAVKTDKQALQQKKRPRDAGAAGDNAGISSADEDTDDDGDTPGPSSKRSKVATCVSKATANNRKQGGGGGSSSKAEASPAGASIARQGSGKGAGSSKSGGSKLGGGRKASGSGKLADQLAKQESVTMDDSKGKSGLSKAGWSKGRPPKAPRMPVTSLSDAHGSTAGKGLIKQMSGGKGKGWGKGGSTPTRKRRTPAGSDDSDDTDDSDFDVEEEEEEEEEVVMEVDGGDEEADEGSDEEGEEAAPTRRRFGHYVNVPSGWKEKAEAEADRMIAKAAAAKKAAMSAQKGVEQTSVLHQVAWRRIILDEAHSIKDRRSSTAKAIFQLNSQYKWGLSGTPLQNRVGELYSLIRFLRLYPYAYYFCRKAHANCQCQSIDYPFTKSTRKCDGCEHAPLTHYCWWNRYVANPIKKFGYQGEGRSAMLLLKNKIMPAMLLRRTKVQCADDLWLPPRTSITRKDRFDEGEADFYEALYTQTKLQFGAYVNSGTVLNNYAHIFDLLIRLRQAVDHPYLVVHSATGTGSTARASGAPSAADALAAVVSAGGGAAGTKISSLPASGSPGSMAVAAAAAALCALCKEDPDEVVVAGCGHRFCRPCIIDYVESAAAAAKCPTCSTPISADFGSRAMPAAMAAETMGQSPGAAGTSASAHDDGGGEGSGPPKVFHHNPRKKSILTRVDCDEFQSSTKIEALREELHRMLQRDPSAKAIVFSQFTSMLELIHFRLEQVGVHCVKLDGSMSMAMRERMISSFTNDPKVTVFLMSLKAGGVALNLTAASHVMLMDPWWNPAVEMQAQDRIHRLGQYKPITVTRFIIAGTIEERILKLQEKKQLVFEGTVGRDTTALGKLTEDDMRFLFS